MAQPKVTKPRDPPLSSSTIILREERTLSIRYVFRHPKQCWTPLFFHFGEIERGKDKKLVSGQNIEYREDMSPSVASLVHLAEPCLALLNIAEHC